MLSAGGVHLATGEAGSREHIEPTIDGHALERWFPKTICGAIAAEAIEGVCDIPLPWVRGLFGEDEWPEEWSFYVETGTRRIGREHASIGMHFFWSNAGAPMGLSSMHSPSRRSFSLVAPDFIDGAVVLQRPPGLGVRIGRPNGAAALGGMVPGEDVTFRIRWP